ncbi:MAG: HD domain-containing protein [Candidatus Micrarchaeota archaeon]|nr:HD domain-containing protein [Candidatus Micrarchaeota archaeon]MCX8202224.1 HD domain-containing protein [Candidatus Micrarchaeota archaeon]
MRKFNYEKKEKVKTFSKELAVEPMIESNIGKKRIMIKELLNLPQIQAGKDLWQNPFHEFDVFTHTTKFVEFIEKMTDDLDVIAAGCLHDIGKPVVAKPKYKDNVLQEKEPGKPYHEFDDHEKVGEEIVRKLPPSIFEKYGLNQEKIAILVGAHYLPMKGIKAMRAAKDYKEFETAYQNLVEKLEKTGYKNEVLTMFVADKLAQGKGCTDREELMAIWNLLVNNIGNLESIYKIQRNINE